MNDSVSLNNIRKWSTILLVIFISGFFLYLMSTLVSYHYMNLNGFISHAEQGEITEKMMNMSQIASVIEDTCATIFCFGTIMITYRLVKSKDIISSREVLNIFGRMVVILLAIAGVFSMINPDAIGDIFYPLWSTLIVLTVNMVVILCYGFFKKKGEKR
ncbi:magnesium-transporting ATPase (P-type) [Clostridiales Family XIII bacterium PM5-7]